jgi:hypothetical protein
MEVSFLWVEKIVLRSQVLGYLGEVRVLLVSLSKALDFFWFSLNFVNVGHMSECVVGLFLSESQFFPVPSLQFFKGRTLFFPGL